VIWLDTAQVGGDPKNLLMVNKNISCFLYLKFKS
jgi:hypothetical protein